MSFFFVNSWAVSFMMLVLGSFFFLINMNQFFEFSMNFIFHNTSISSIMLFLSSILCLLVLISTPDYKKSFFKICIFFLLFFLILTFSSNNVMFFYIFFEATLIPTLMLVSYWGYQPERLQAGSYMMLYTVCASLPLLLMMLYNCNKSNSMMMVFSINTFYYNFIIILMVYGAFLVKLPMYSVHLWLPKAHVEASLAGSMLLAGILLKLGGYGIFQMNLLFNISGSKSFPLIIIMSLGLWGGLLSSFMCLKQTDMKSFVAYSSVSHMSLIILGLLNDSFWGYFSSLITMFAHGFSSSALFCLTYYTYVKFYSRSMIHINGMISIFPKLSMLWFIYCCINMAMPPSLNLLGEMLITPVMLSLSNLFLLILGLMIFFSGLYNMYLYTMINHGMPSIYSIPSEPVKGYQYMSIFSHMIPLLFLFKLEAFMCS
uniref:NADH-ubiquinone oxidoreductase chain 4 n=1 Tax=Planorbis carinatus TaxID=446412 RepID=A0A7D7ACW8_9GAST|nr:NADH dehydrogenase subunit 4 [Planorbis carinatus]